MADSDRKPYTPPAVAGSFAYSAPYGLRSGLVPVHASAVWEFHRARTTLYASLRAHLAACTLENPAPAGRGFEFQVKPYTPGGTWKK